MEKINQESRHPNDVPVIFLYDENGKIKRKISINEWRSIKAVSQEIETFEIKLYREAINYYTAKDYIKACDLLNFLISRTDFTHFEYVERLANIYRKQQKIQLEKQLLLNARKSIKALEYTEGIIQRIDKRLEKIENSLSNHSASIQKYV